MNIIQNAVQDLSSIIHSLETRSKEISDIVNVITSISKQTNSLALHASIEASRAEANGDGFAVVADKVRNLAEQTEASAKDIAKLIGKHKLKRKKLLFQYKSFKGSRIWNQTFSK